MIDKTILDHFDDCPHLTEVRQLLEDAASGENGSEAVVLNHRTFANDILFRASTLGRQMSGDHRIALIGYVRHILDARPPVRNLVTRGK